MVRDVVEPEDGLVGILDDEILAIILLHNDVNDASDDGPRVVHAKVDLLTEFDWLELLGAQAVLAGVDNLKFGYITRYNVKDSSRHIILGTQQFKPIECGQQINLSMDNAWAIVRCVIDIVMKQSDGKYLIVKDPNKAILRLYDIPNHTFDSDEDTSESEDETAELIDSTLTNLRG